MELLNKRISVCIVVIFMLMLFPICGDTADKLPTIEELTNGKVKIGDLVDKNNVDLVKEYLSSGVYELVKRGLVLRMAKQEIPPEKLTPKTFQEATERNRGKAIINEKGVVYLKDGSLWPGGLPFPDPKTGNEVMGNVKYGIAYSDLLHDPNWIFYINKKGERYKKVGQYHKWIITNCRTKLPPLGTIPGYKDVLYKRLSATTYPLEIKGLGQFNVRYYDDAEKYDTGFVYLPAFKRTIRVSAITWQDNIAGSDLIYGDANATLEPYCYWNFKFIKKTYLLTPELKNPFTYYDEKGNFDKRLKFDEGYKFPRLGWAILPAHIVEATPKIKHLYKKKLFYVVAYPYWLVCSDILMTDNFDLQNKLWRVYFHLYGDYYELDGETYHLTYGCLVYDFQSEHSTQMWYKEYLDRGNYKPEDVTLRSLLEWGR
ncbi:MAG: DUF1329 domain-containing protein [Thermodesulfobacteriota bacterium]|nr:DUF1329 domain-containing protein [Thermodesulfobacteriota bacterium]